MNTDKIDNISLSEVHETIDTTSKGKNWKKIFSFIGPAYLVSVGYMDPGNWATDIAAGSKYGYSLIWVLLVSNIMAIILQSLSARLGIVRGRDLAQANREFFPLKINFILWIMAEIAIAATDLAEVLGMAIGIQLLFGIPLIYGVGITVLDTFLLLYLQRLGIRKIEAFIIVLIVIIGICFLFNIIISNPNLHEIIVGFIPSLPSPDQLYLKTNNTGVIPKETALYLAIGMIGATIMPHNLYLHSALIQTRKIKRTNKGIKEALKWSVIDSSIALNVAFLINAAILILSATVFFNTGRTDVGEIKEAHQLLSPILGSKFASLLFAIALIASGQSSTITGTLSGQIVMEGYLKIRINPALRRLITRLLAIIPAIFFIILMGEDKIDKLLIFSQVILSVQLSFAIIPLIYFVSEKKMMREFAIKKSTQITAWIITGLLLSLNIKMIHDELVNYMYGSNNSVYKILIIVALIILLSLLLFILIYPITKKSNNLNTIHLHNVDEKSVQIELPTYKKIGIALDFRDDHNKLLSTAIGQSKADTEIILIHVVESATGKIHGNETADYESQKDKETLEQIVLTLQNQGIHTRGILGFKDPANEIIRISKMENIDLLIIGAHGHKGIKDFIFGTTIDVVRHELKIPVFIVNL